MWNFHLYVLGTDSIWRDAASADLRADGASSAPKLEYRRQFQVANVNALTVWNK